MLFQYAALADEGDFLEADFFSQGLEIYDGGEVSLIPNEESALSVEDISPWTGSQDAAVGLFAFAFLKFVLLQQLAVAQGCR
ncbi:uncharacterized protein METZ01_LOCUS422906 [marine metagenome]|uniref:Uncharacterized protein n=1 Tax=marine metagenome TaxID=408172 RepID=A0A382XG60_9ZZZZ